MITYQPGLSILLRINRLKRLLLYIQNYLLLHSRYSLRRKRWKPFPFINPVVRRPCFLFVHNSLTNVAATTPIGSSSSSSSPVLD